MHKANATANRVGNKYFSMKWLLVATSTNVKGMFFFSCFLVVVLLLCEDVRSCVVIIQDILWLNEHSIEHWTCMMMYRNIL